MSEAKSLRQEDSVFSNGIGLKERELQGRPLRIRSPHTRGSQTGFGPYNMSHVRTSCRLADKQHLYSVRYLFANVSFYLFCLFIFRCWHRVLCCAFLFNAFRRPVGILSAVCGAQLTSVAQAMATAESHRNWLYFQGLRIRTTKASCNWNRPKFVCGDFFSLCHTHTPTLLYCTPDHSNIHDTHTRLS